MQNDSKCYQGLAEIYCALGMTRTPYHKTMHNTMLYLDEKILSTINRVLLSSKTKVCDIDSSGMKTHHKGAMDYHPIQVISKET